MTENFVSSTKAARDFCEAIRTIASKLENMENLECYLAAHFETWLEKMDGHARKPCGRIERVC